jgi:hypothetical protein
LPLEGALERLVELHRIRKVDDVDVAIGGANHEQVLADIHGVDALLAGNAADWVARPQIPVFDGLVPRAGNQHRAVGVWQLEELGTFDGLIVSGDLNSLQALEVTDFGLLVGAGRDDLVAVLG